ncbi:MAG: Trk family potassium uptake protein [Chloroflexi bacterium]|nr:Trk family potassium uptake protein [Chloroflexota bacterium]
MQRLGQRLPGNVVVRRRRQRPETVQVSLTRRRRFRPQPWMVPAAFAGLIALGALLLALPIASESREWTNGWDALFTSTSALCVTGLVRFDTAEHFSLFGEAVILVLIQLGGLGVTIYAGMLILLVGGQFGLRGRDFFGIELMGDGERDMRRLMRRAALFMLTLEATTFLLLLPWSLAQWDPLTAVWRAFFHALSAANCAGFDLMGGSRSFTGQVEDPYPIIVMGVSTFIGALSFVTVFNLRAGVRRWTLDTRLVVIGMVSLQVVGMMMFAVSEWVEHDPISELSPIHAFANVFFMAANRTTGMTTVDIAELHTASVMLLLPLMFIGGASTSSASGIKVGSFMITILAMISALRGRHSAQAFGREIPQAIVLRAVAVASLGVILLGLGVWLMLMLEDRPLLPVLFETLSALANIGWTFGITPDLSTPSVVLATVLMFIGRLGPMIVAFSIPDRPQERYRYAHGRVRIG